MDKKYLALTFDDGPNNIVTPVVLDKLEKYNITATFFVEGMFVSDETKDVIERALKIGCEYQNHSMTHRVAPELTKEEIEYEVYETDKLIEKYTGTVPKFFRPPAIRVNNLLFDTITDKYFICGVCSSDWSKDEPKEETARIILPQIKNGDIILLHDSAHNMKSAEALDLMIPPLLEQGYEFVNISKLFEIFSVENKRGIVFSGAFREHNYNME